MRTPLPLPTLLLALTACQPLQSTGAPPMENEDAPIDLSAGDCDAAPAQKLIGQTATQALGADALRLTRSKQLRWAPPGAILTMDYRMDRVTVGYDERMVVTSVRCG